MKPGYLRRFVIADEKNNSIAEVTLRAPKGKDEAFLPPNTLALDCVWVDPAHRRQGLAWHLLGTAQEFAKGRDMRIAVRPQAHGEGGRTQGELEGYYKRRGWAYVLQADPLWLV